MNNTSLQMEETFRIGKQLASMGFAIHWLKPSSKQPIKKGWSTMTLVSWEALTKEYKVGFNIGCRTGEYTQFKDGTALIVFDVDLKGGESYKTEALEKLTKILNVDLNDFPYVQSPRGRHYYARCSLNTLPRSIKLAKSHETCEVIMEGKMEKRTAWELELLSTGKQVVIPPSIHPDTKTQYKFSNLSIDTVDNIPMLTDDTIRNIKKDKNLSSVELKKVEMPDELSIQSYDISDFDLPENVIHLIVNGVPKGERSEKLYYAAIEMLKIGMLDDQVCSVLTDARYKLSEKPLEERRGNILSAAEWVFKYCILPAKKTFDPVIPFEEKSTPALEPPLEVLGKLGAIIKTISECVQVSPAMALNSCLGVFSLLTQGISNIDLGTDYKPLSLYFITIAHSGDRKTTIDNIFLAPVKNYQSQLIRDYRLSNDSFQIENKVANAKEHELLSIKKTRGKTCKEISETLLEDLDKPIKPRYPLLLTNEPTYEGLVKQLDVGYPSMGVFSSEGGRFIGGHAMNKENRLKTASSFSSLWDGDSIDRVRGGDGVFLLENRRITIHLMMQPIVMEEEINASILKDQGFLSRFLIVYPESLAGTRFYQDSSATLDDAKQKYSTLIDKLLKHSLDFDQQSGKINLRIIKIDQAAQIEWIGFYNALESELVTDGCYQSISEFASKAGEHTKRLAAILSLVDDPNSELVSLESMKKAIQLMCYYVEERLRVETIQSRAPILKAAKKIANKLIDLSKTCYSNFCLEDIYKNNRFVRTADKAREIFGYLEEHNYIFKLPFGGKRKERYKKEMWILNPKVLEDDRYLTP
jgi:hypothetical protein